MNDDEGMSLKQFQWVLGAGLAFIISSCYAWDELRHSIWAKRAEANVTNNYVVKETKGVRRRREIEVRVIEFTYTDENKRGHAGKDRVPVTWQIENNQVPIEYFPGATDSARLVGNNNFGWVYIFFFCLIALIVALGMLIRHAQQELADKPKRKTKKR